MWDMGVMTVNLMTMVVCVDSVRLGRSQETLGQTRTSKETRGREVGRSLMRGTGLKVGGWAVVGGGSVLLCEWLVQEYQGRQEL